MPSQGAQHDVTAKLLGAFVKTIRGIGDFKIPLESSGKMYLRSELYTPLIPFKEYGFVFSKADKDCLIFMPTPLWERFYTQCFHIPNHPSLSQLLRDSVPHHPKPAFISKKRKITIPPHGREILDNPPPKHLLLNTKNWWFQLWTPKGKQRYQADLSQNLSSQDPVKPPPFTPDVLQSYVPWKSWPEVWRSCADTHCHPSPEDRA